MNELTAVQARVLGSLMEKKETTPDQYPLTLKSLCNACNQKSSRFPVTAYTEGDVGHAVRKLEGMGLVNETWGSRAARYEHAAPKILNIHAKGVALLTTLILRGPQTLGELRNHSHRMYAFDDLDDVHYALEKLAEHEPPLIVPLPRITGQKEGRYAHLLCGQPEISEPPCQPAQAAQSAVNNNDLEKRIASLESELESIRDRLEALEKG